MSAVTTPTSTTRRKPRTRGLVGRPGAFTYSVLTLVLITAAYPLWWSFVVGSGTNATRGETLPLIPGLNFLGNVARVLDAIDFWEALLNSLIISVVITVSVVTFSTLAGYAFAKLRFNGRDGLMIFVIATMAIPTQLGIIPLFMVMKQLDWTGEIISVIVPYLVTAFGVFFMRQYLVDAIPDELVEAARVDGCSMFRIFRHVAVPAARPAAAMLWLFTFMYVWTDFFWPLIVLPGDNPTVQIALNQLQSGYYKDYALVLAGATLATIPLLVLFIATGKQFVTGIMQGAVKG